MNTPLAYNTVTPLLRSVLTDIMSENLFDDFLLVGGTALSLRLGHRESVDIDLFTDKEYGNIDFNLIDTYFKETYPYVDSLSTKIIVGMGKSFYVGKSASESIKVDVFYNETFIRPYDFIDNIRLSNLDDIVAMKIDVVQRKGRKKDFWDLHELLDMYTIDQMIKLHEERYPYSHSRDIIIENFIDFDRADNDFDPLCFRGKFWDGIKIDFYNLITNFGTKL